MKWLNPSSSKTSKHLEFKEIDAFLFLKKLSKKFSYQIRAFDFQPSNSKNKSHFCYVVFKNKAKAIFINIIKINITDGDIDYVTESNTHGSNFVNCPMEFLELLHKPITKEDRDWRKQVVKNKRRINKIVILNEFKLVLKHFDVTRYETKFTQKIDLREHPLATKLQIGDSINFQDYGIVSKNDFLNSELYPYDVDDNFNSKLVIVDIKTERILV